MAMNWSTASTCRPKISAPGAKIVAQGTIAITARYLNINGLIQSGAQNVELHVDNTFTPGPTGELLAANGEPLQGVNFGAEGIPVKAYFDAAQQAIVVDDIVPEGGRVILAKPDSQHRQWSDQGRLWLCQRRHHQYQRLQADRQPDRYHQRPGRQDHHHRHGPDQRFECQ
ncbi:hypothetical protein LP420_40305 [Massilia sp. B-10]|nr:hypothetical protein LP420_40305 [Massilia sp. B-10]